MRLVECEGRPGCRLRHGSWYTSVRKQHQLAAYRNLLLTEVLRITEGDATARLLVMDVDLGVAISPLGVLHTLGVQPKAAVAASGASARCHAHICATAASTSAPSSGRRPSGMGGRWRRDHELMEEAQGAGCEMETEYVRQCVHGLCVSLLEPAQVHCHQFVRHY